MNNNLDNLFKLLVPVVFMILWALNQLFNKENAPQQAGRPSGGLGPRPGSQPGSPALRSSPAPSRPEGLGPRPSFPTTQPDSSPVGDDEIMILRSESIQPPVGPKVTPREPREPRRSRGRPVRAGESRPARPVRSPEPRPLPSQAPALTPATPPPSTSDSPILIGVPPQLSAARVQQALNHPARVREAYLVSEILRPPVALRGRPGTRDR